MCVKPSGGGCANAPSASGLWRRSVGSRQTLEWPAKGGVAGALRLYARPLGTAGCC